jgi:hypothetical protein
VITTRKLTAYSVWLGFALGALFLYPLAVALDSDIFYMQWQQRDSYETIAALLLLWIVFGGLVFALWRRPGRLATLALGLIAAVPILSFLAGLARQLPFDDALIRAWENPTLRYGLPAVAVLAVVGPFVAWPERFGRWFRRGLLALSFVSIVVVESFVAASTYAAPLVRVEQQGTAVRATSCPSIVALLFDELSFAYLYEGAEVRSDFPALRRLSSTSTNYLDVHAPADETLVALPGYLAGRHVESVRIEGMNLLEVGADGKPVPYDPGGPTSLFPTARARGYRTEMGGYYLPYCYLLGELVDTCRSLSLYNASTTGNGFSPVHPLVTTLIMWPRQFPFGLVKNPPFARLQKNLVEELSAFARRPLPVDGAVFRFVHFSVPHLPFVFDAQGYNPPFNPLRTSPDDAYVRQLHYVDRLVGEIVADMQRAGTFNNTTFIVFADHGFRFGGRERDKLHIPFIVKQAGQRARTDVTAAQRGELLLRDLVGGSCHVP